MGCPPESNGLSVLSTPGTDYRGGGRRLPNPGTTHLVGAPTPLRQEEVYTLETWLKRFGAMDSSQHLSLGRIDYP